ncbi:MAG: hypothetical protein ABSH19_02620 [Opitutales bacterium]|jgi:hypothetical protein
MSMPIRLSDELLGEARESGRRFHRSIPQQVEHWAQIGRVLESALILPSVGKLKDLSREPDLEKMLAAAEMPAGKEKVKAQLRKMGRPLYSSDPENPGGVIRHWPDGSRARGRVVNRKFIPQS